MTVDTEECTECGHRIHSKLGGPVCASCLMGGDEA